MISDRQCGSCSIRLLSTLDLVASAIAVVGICSHARATRERPFARVYARVCRQLLACLERRLTLLAHVWPFGGVHVASVHVQFAECAVRYTIARLARMAARTHAVVFPAVCE